MDGNKNLYVNGKPTTSRLAPIILGLALGAGFGGVPWASLVLPALIEDQFYLIYYVIGIICIIGMVICIKYLPKRTPYGNEMLGKIKGFKSYLETAEKEKLETMVLQNPTYFPIIIIHTTSNSIIHCFGYKKQVFLLVSYLGFKFFSYFIYYISKYNIYFFII